MLVDHFPLVELRLTTPRLELRLPSPEELATLADAARRRHPRPGRHAPHCGLGIPVTTHGLAPCLPLLGITSA
ncbi:hypothetical protein [Allokutzneria albata]|uniref:Uncharacterized protein n=1 Tax=Allokutzneria albata TaxID=211114 RepID=A0A1G9WEZ2_ALLAB|nr:hypothetical protein [Allokutzneria albata]SDM83059.1 hypothetical protein SAMN04489726_3572 [Allokutzneria albata]